jgi:hypothetical protein
MVLGCGGERIALGTELMPSHTSAVICILQWQCENVNRNDKRRRRDIGEEISALTSVNSSIVGGLMSTMLKLWSLTPRFQRFTRRSSAEMKVSSSELTEIELM